MANCKLLLKDGSSFLLLHDGVSELLLRDNTCSDDVVVTPPPPDTTIHRGRAIGGGKKESLAAEAYMSRMWRMDKEREVRRLIKLAEGEGMKAVKALRAIFQGEDDVD